MPLPGRGRVALDLGVDERRLRAVGVDVAGGGQRRDDAPAQIGVDRQTGQSQLGGIVVQQVGQHRDVPRATAPTSTAR